MSEPAIPQCAACRVAGTNAHCDACPSTPWQEYASSEDGMREYAKEEPVVPDLFAEYGKLAARVAELESDASDATDFGQAESERYEAALDVLEAQVAEQAAELDKWREREASVCPEDYGFEEVIKAQAATIERLTNVLTFLRKTLPEEYWDSNELAQIDAALKQRMEAKKL